MLRRATVSFALTVFAALRLQAACSTPSVQQLTPLETGHDFGEIAFFATGDVDRDGNLDLAVPSETTDDVRIFLGNGDGTFDEYVSYPATNARHVEIVDLNNDTWPDLAVTQETGVAVLLNDGDGTFGAAVSYNANLLEPQSLHHADFNDDGFEDLLVADLPDPDQPNVRILWNNGSGGFPSRNEWLVAGDAARALAADFNQDGYEDVAVVYRTDSTTGKFSIFVGGPNGVATTASTTVTLNGLNTVSTALWLDMELANLNGDADPDLVVAFGEGYNGWRGTSGTSFVAHGGYVQTPGNWSAIGSADFNEDAVSDILMVTRQSGEATFFLTTGPGTFIPQPKNVTIGGQHSDLRIGDFDNDGRPDALVADYANGDILLLRNTCSPRYVDITINAGSVTYPNDATVTVTVAQRSGPTTPTGTVTLKDNNVTVATQPLVNGVATFTITRPVPGNHALQATYNGDGLYGSRMVTGFYTVDRHPYGPPLDVRATRVGNNIRVTWTGSAGSEQYQVYRMSGGTWQLLFHTPAEQVEDTMVPNTMPQIYAVTATAVGLPPTALSAPDVANTFNYSSTLPIGGPIRAADIYELRTLINGLRANIGLAAFNFTDPNLTGVFIKAVHLNELRSALAEAAGYIGIRQPTYTQPAITPGVTVRAADLRDLRTALD